MLIGSREEVNMEVSEKLIFTIILQVFLTVFKSCIRLAAFCCGRCN